MDDCPFVKYSSIIFCQWLVLLSPSLVLMMSRKACFWELLSFVLGHCPHMRNTTPQMPLNARNCADDTFFHRSEAILKAGGFVSAFCCARPAVLFQTARWLESANMLQQIAGVRKSNMLLKCMCIRDAEFESEFAPNLIHEGQVLRNQTVEI